MDEGQLEGNKKFRKRKSRERGRNWSEARNAEQLSDKEGQMVKRLHLVKKMDFKVNEIRTGTRATGLNLQFRHRFMMVL